MLHTGKQGQHSSWTQTLLSNNCLVMIPSTVKKSIMKQLAMSLHIPLCCTQHHRESSIDFNTQFNQPELTPAAEVDLT